MHLSPLPLRNHPDEKKSNKSYQGRYRHGNHRVVIHVTVYCIDTKNPGGHGEEQNNQMDRELSSSRGGVKKLESCYEAQDPEECAIVRA